MIAPMLSPATLTAFSAGAAASGFAAPAPIHRVRGVSEQVARPSQPAAPATLASPRDGGADAGRPLPRGSLLDLSV